MLDWQVQKALSVEVKLQSQLDHGSSVEPRRDAHVVRFKRHRIHHVELTEMSSAGRLVSPGEAYSYSCSGRAERSFLNRDIHNFMHGMSLGSGARSVGFTAAAEASATTRRSRPASLSVASSQDCSSVCRFARAATSTSAD